MVPANQYLDTLAISRERWQMLLDELDQMRCEAPDAANRRRTRRASCRDALAAFLDVEHPSGARSSFLVRPRDISRTGFGFIHGAFLHPTSRVELTLVTPQKRLIRRCGRVSRCRYVRGKVHEVGIVFDQAFAADPLAAAGPADGRKMPAA
jgi:hypothetical protein